MYSSLEIFHKQYATSANVTLTLNASYYKSLFNLYKHFHSVSIICIITTFIYLPT